MQGSVTATGGGGQLELDNVVIASGRTITDLAFTLTAPMRDAPALPALR